MSAFVRLNDKCVLLEATVASLLIEFLLGLGNLLFLELFRLLLSFNSFLLFRLWLLLRLVELSLNFTVRLLFVTVILRVVVMIFFLTWHVLHYVSKLLLFKFFLPDQFKRMLLRWEKGLGRFLVNE